MCERCDASFKKCDDCKFKWLKDGKQLGHDEFQRRINVCSKTCCTNADCNCCDCRNAYPKDVAKYNRKRSLSVQEQWDAYDEWIEKTNTKDKQMVNPTEIVWSAHFQMWICEREKRLPTEYQCRVCNCHVEAREFESFDDYLQMSLYKFCVDCEESYYLHSYEVKGLRFSRHEEYYSCAGQCSICSRCIQDKTDFLKCEKCKFVQCLTCYILQDNLIWDKTPLPEFAFEGSRFYSNRKYAETLKSAKCVEYPCETCKKHYCGKCEASCWRHGKRCAKRKRSKKEKFGAKV